MINWQYRIRVVWLSVIYSLSIVTYLMIKGNGTSELHSAIVSNLLILVGSIVGGFVFGVVADNFFNGTNDMTADHPPPEEVGEENDKTAVGKDTKYGHWKNRRKILFVCMLWCSAVVAYLAIYAADNALNRTLANGTVFLAGGLIISYLFGVVLNTKSLQSGLGR